MVSTHRRSLAALAIVALVVLAGCSGAGSDAAGTQAVEMSADTGGATVVATNGDSGSGSAQSVAVRQRALIRTGQIRLEVESFENSQANLTADAARMGGFVSDSSEQVHREDNRTWTSGRLVLRVPKDNFSALYEAAKAEGTVREASTSTKDVTEQLIDVEARLENLRAQREKLRDLYNRSNDTGDVLDVQERLSEVQTEIERLQTRQESLERRVAYSTITVELVEPRPDRPEDPSQAWYETGLLTALGESFHGVVVVLRAFTVGVAYAAPYLLVFGAPVVAGVGLWLRR